MHRYRTRDQSKPSRDAHKSPSHRPDDQNVDGVSGIIMLSRAFASKPTKRLLYGEQVYGGGSEPSVSYDDCVVGFTDGDVALATCGHRHAGGACGPAICGAHTMKEVVRSSVGVMGESGFGMTEKVVLSEGRVRAVKRFSKVLVRRKEFGRRVDRFAEVSRMCDRLVPVTAYLYTKRFKFVLCDYFPMGSLADLLAGGREQDHTALNWKQSLAILFDTARAIEFVHTCDSRDKNINLNVHGNVKASNVMVGVDFSARVSGYGFSQIAGRINLSGNDDNNYNNYQFDLTQDADVHNFGVIALDVIGGRRVSRSGTLEEAKKGVVGFEGEVERKQAMKVLEIGWACVGKPTPSIEDVTLRLEGVYLYDY